MDNAYMPVRTDPKRRAQQAGDGPVDYVGRHVRVERAPASRNPHPRGHGFRVLSRLARASEGGHRHLAALAS
jgi:hypothetical protein